MTYETAGWFSPDAKLLDFAHRMGGIFCLVCDKRSTDISLVRSFPKASMPPNTYNTITVCTPCYIEKNIPSAPRTWEAYLKYKETQNEILAVLETTNTRIKTQVRTFERENQKLLEQAEDLKHALQHAQSTIEIEKQKLAVLEQYKIARLQQLDQIKQLSSQALTILETEQTKLDEFCATEQDKPVLCPICRIESITHVLVPCGHTYCIGCLKSTKMETCTYCKSIIHSCCRIYLTM